MSIGYVVSKYPAISHTFVQREVLALREQGLTVHTFSVRKTPQKELLSETDRTEAATTFSLLPRPLIQVIAAHGCELLRSPVRYILTLWFAILHGSSNLYGLWRSFCYFAEAILLAREARRLKITRLHSHFINSGGEVSLIASRHLQIRWSCTLHGLSDYGNPLANRLSRKIELADAVVCVTDFGRAQAMLASSMDQWHKINVVRCGLDRDMLQIKPTPDCRSNRLRLVTVGRLSPEKAHTGLLEAIRMVVDRGIDVVLTIIGDGPLANDLQQRVQSLDLSDRVTLAGAQSPNTVRSVIADADLCVMSSLMEGLPVTLMESFAQCRPVIAPAVAGIPELVKPDENGWLFSASRWDELAACIEDAVRKKSRLAGMGRRGRSRILAEYTSAKSATRLAKIFGVSNHGSEIDVLEWQEEISTPRHDSETKYRKLGSVQEDVDSDAEECSQLVAFTEMSRS